MFIKNILDYLSPTKCFVKYVLDGDTVLIQSGTCNIFQKKVRLIGINADEIEHPDFPENKKIATPMGYEAKTYLKQKLEGKYVSLSFDSMVEPTDKYSRVLAYVLLDKVDVAIDLFERGYCRVLDYKKLGFTQLEIYKKLEATAKAKKLGIWKSVI